MPKKRAPCSECDRAVALLRCTSHVCENCSCNCPQHKAYKKRRFFSSARATLVYDTVQAIAEDIQAFPRRSHVGVLDFGANSETNADEITPDDASLDFGDSNDDVCQQEPTDPVALNSNELHENSASQETPCFPSPDNFNGNVPLGTLEVDFASRYANIVIAHDLLVTIYPGKLFCLPSPTPALTELTFDSSSAHIFVHNVQFAEGPLEMLFCTVCKTTRNSLTKELVRGESSGHLRRMCDFDAQCCDPESVHVAAFRIARTNQPCSSSTDAVCGISEIPPGVQFGLTVATSTKVFASVHSESDIMDRVLIQLHGENLWRCLKCTKTAMCSHRVVWNAYLQLAHVDSTVDFNWISEGDVQASQAERLRRDQWTYTPFPVTAQAQSLIRQRRGFSTFCHFASAEFTPTQLKSPMCKCGGQFSLNTWTEDCRGMVYGLLSCREIRVPKFHCHNLSCTATLAFDGMFHGFLRTGSKTFFEMDLVNMIRLNVLVGATPLSATYKVVQGLYSAQEFELCSRSVFVTSCWTILSCLDVDLVSCFNCAHCGSLDTAPIIVGDGNAKMACRREYASPRHPEVGVGIPIQARTYLRNVRARALLLHFCGSRAHQGDRAPQSMTSTQREELRALLLQHAASLVPLFDVIVGEQLDPSGLCPATWRTFLSDLARQSPVQGAVIREPSKMTPILLALSSPRSRLQALGVDKPYVLRSLQQNAPTLAKVLRATNLDNEPMHCVWDRLAVVLQHLAVNFCSNVQETDPNEPSHSIPREALYDDEALHEWFPGAPVRRLLRTYSNVHRLDDTVCTKHAPSLRCKMPGIFHFCCPHGICLGFTTLHDHESPMHPFTILCQRWTNTSAPRIVVMDNACNLHTYCLRREPWLFRNVWFLVDRLHYANHVNCSSGYKIDNYPFLKDISTVACEIFNGTLKSVVKQAGFMSMKNFILFTKLYIKGVNDKREDQVALEMRQGGLKRETWRGVNELIRQMQDVLLAASPHVQSRCEL